MAEIEKFKRIVETLIDSNLFYNISEIVFSDDQIITEFYLCETIYKLEVQYFKKFKDIKIYWGIDWQIKETTDSVSFEEVFSNSSDDLKDKMIYYFDLLNQRGLYQE